MARERDTGTGVALERPQPPGAEESWHECWSFDFAQRDGLGGFVRLVTFPNAGRAWCWVYVISPEHGLVVVRDHHVALPRRAGSLEIRAEALWAELVCETPMEHWGIGVEAFGVALDDPLDGYRGEIGTRVAVGLDLEWVLDALPATERDAYEQPGRVQGDVLIGTDRIAFDGFGLRTHAWGDHRWWSHDGHRVRVGLDDLALSVRTESGPGAGGARAWQWRPGAAAEAVAVRSSRVSMGDDGFPTEEHLQVGETLALVLDVRSVAAVPLDPGGVPVAGLVRALCAVESADGRRGAGWAEWCHPGDPSRDRSV